MKEAVLKGVVACLFCLVLYVSVGRSFQTGPPPGVTGVPAGEGIPAEPTCIQSGCHETFPLNPDTRGRIELTGVPDNYIPGQRYSVTFRITHPDTDRRRWGFQVTTISLQDFRPAGNLEVTDRRNTQIVTDPLHANRQYIEHTILGTGQGRTGGFSWTFAWVAPDSNIGDVAFFGAGNAANGDSQPRGDKIYNPTPNPLAVAKGQFIFRNVAASAHVGSPAGEGVAVGDFDNDGREDIYIARDGQDALYRNNGDGTFTDVARQAGIVENNAGRAAAWGDFDQDGNLDLYVVNVGSDRLYRNNGDGTFSDVSAQVGISDEAPGHAVAWGDVNGDKWLDIYVANEGQDTLYLNRAGVFVKADPATAGLVEEAVSWTVALADFNSDGRLDIFVGHEGRPALYRNNGDGTFTDIAPTAGIRTNASARAAAWGDFDKDGHPDLFVATTGQDFLFRNKGDGTFADVTTQAGLADTAVGRAAVWADYDRDGDLDLFVANEGQDFLYRNNGNGTFNEVASFSGLTETAAARAAAWLDFDKDGNPDLFVVNAEGERNLLYRNPGRSGVLPETLFGRWARRARWGVTALSVIKTLWAASRPWNY
jgi:hypothetical protein